MKIRMKKLISLGLIVLNIMVRRSASPVWREHLSGLTEPPHLFCY